MYLTQQELHRLARALRTRHRELAAEAQDGAERSREAARQSLEESVGDDGDRAAALMLTSLQSAEFSRDVRELRDVEVALRRIDEGAYGACVDCGRAIGLPRLRANPAAQRCVECQSIFERTFAQPGRTTP